MAHGHWPNYNSDNVLVSLHKPKVGLMFHSHITSIAILSHVFTWKEIHYVWIYFIHWLIPWSKSISYLPVVRIQKLPFKIGVLELAIASRGLPLRERVGLFHPLKLLVNFECSIQNSFAGSQQVRRKARANLWLELLLKVIDLARLASEGCSHLRPATSASHRQGPPMAGRGKTRKRKKEKKVKKEKKKY